MVKYITPEIEIIEVNNFLLASSSKYNNVGNFGPGDKDDDDKTGDNNWDKDWNWND